MNDCWGLTSKKHTILMRDGVVEDSEIIDNLGFFKVHPHPSTQTSSIFASIENANPTIDLIL